MTEKMNQFKAYTQCRRWGIAALIVGVYSMLAPQAQAINVELQVSITDGFLANAAGTALPVNSVVYVIVSQSPFVNPNFPSTTPPSAEEVNTDPGPIDSGEPTELLVATIRTDDILADGTFFPTSVGLVDISTYQYVYLRFFDYQGSTPVLGSNIAWGVSSVVSNVFDEGFGFAEATFTGTNQTLFTNTFVVIPEPGTFQLIFVSGTLLFLLGGTGLGRKALYKFRSG